MYGARILPALLALALSLCLASSADARKGRSWRHFDFGRQDYSDHSEDDRWRGHTVGTVEPSRANMGGGGIGTVLDRLIAGCARQAADLQNWPFDEIARIVTPDETQRSALEVLHASATAGAQRLSAVCPQDQPAPPAVQLERAQQVIDAATSTFTEIEPPLQTFYAELDDEQKARLVRDLTLSGSHARQRDRAAERSAHRHRWRSDSARADEGSAWGGICERLAAALRGWPIQEIERDVRLSEAQRAAFYELVNSSLKAAETLSSTCLAETALTAPVRMASLRQRLSAVRQATVAIGPALTRFYEALDQGQKVRFAGMR